MSKENKDKSAFPAKVNAMGYEGGLTKLEFISALILATSDKDIKRLDNAVQATLAIRTAEALLTELDKKD